MRIQSVLLWSVMALGFSGCAMVKVSVAENRRIGVVALIPDKLQTKYVGIWAFSNKSADADVPEAKFRHHVTMATVEALRSKGFDAVPVGLDHPEWWDKYDKHRRSLGSYFTTVTIGDKERRSLGRELESALASQHLDAFALVVPGAKSGGGEATIGVGDYGFGTLTGDKEEISVYAMTDLLVLRGPSLSTKTFRAMRSTQAVAGVPFEGEFRSYSPAQQEVLLQSMRELYRREVLKTVAGMAKP